MPLALLFIGILLVVSGIRNTQSTLGSLLAGDFSGKGNFLYWVAGVGAIGSLGYAKPLQNVSRLFLFLIVLVMLLSDNGFFAQITSALSTARKPAPTSEASSGAAVSDNAGGGGVGVGSDMTSGVGGLAAQLSTAAGGDAQTGQAVSAITTAATMFMGVP
jgi:hypothetical protein